MRRKNVSTCIRGAAALFVLGFLLLGCDTGLNNDQSGTGTGTSTEQGDSHRVLYRANGGSGSPPSDSKTYSSGEQAIVLEKGDDLSYLDRDFMGWNTEPNGEGESFQAGDSLIIEDGNVILYAQWESGIVIRFFDSEHEEFEVFPSNELTVFRTGEDYMVYLSVSEDFDEIRWYVNGSLWRTNNSEVTFYYTSRDPGVYTVTVVITQGEVFRSGNIRITIKDREV
ncbi:InlB B-repeat-containing protein [Spirochaeta dissipatitropha]